MGNRQGGKMTPRHDLSYQQKPRKQGGKQSRFNVNVDRLSPELRAVLQSMDGGCAGSAVTSPISALHTQAGHGHTLHSSPNFLARVGQEEKCKMSCVPDDQGPKDVRDEIISVDGGNSSQRLFHPHFHGTENILKDSNLQNHQDFSKKESMVSNVFCGSYSSIPFLKHHCMEPDPLTRVTVGVDSSTAVTNLAAACIQRLEHLKKNIEQRNTENVTHFNNAGFAQLQCEAGYGDYDNADVSKVPDTSEHGNKSMSQTTSIMTGVPHLDDGARSKALRKLSEPGQRVVRKDSMSSKTLIPSTWSQSAESSPVIVRKALPSPGSPLIVQRTPSQSPSVERRFPANVSPSSVVPWHATESLDGQQSKQHVCQQLHSRDASLNIRQKTAAEISLSHISTSPISFKKMPESPVLLSSGTQHQRKHTGKEPASNSTKDDRSVADLTLGQKTYKVHCLKALTLSSCSSSSSECPLRTLSSLEDSVSPSVPPCTSSPSSPSATLSSGSPTPITFCPQPKGTPIRTCKMVSQPSTAVFLTSRESQECIQITNEGLSPSKDTEISGEGGKDTHKIITSSHKQPSSSVVTEDTIKQNSQSAVFGSVSPKLLRHRRLMKENVNLSHMKHTFPKQSQSINIITAKTFPSRGENVVLWTGDSVRIDNSDHALINGAGMSAQLSQSAPSAFPAQPPNISASCAGNKTLGQRIREVINEATGGASVTREPSSVWVKTHTKTFSKDDIFTNSSTPEKISWYSFSDAYVNKNQNLKYEKIGPPQNENHIHFIGKRQEGSIDEDHRLKLTLSGADTKDITEDIHLAKSTGHSYHFNSSRDSCSSCLSDSFQMDYYDNAGRQGGVAELTQANVCHQTALLSGGARSRQQEYRGSQRGEAHHRLATSDTSDTLSTDRDTSGSSKRESSTSTATDDTLTSFKTRSTADSVDYEDFVLPKSLVFIRSADREAQNDLCGGFETEQTTVKRKLVHGQSYGVRAEHEPLSYKTRKKRRKQVNVQSQIITAKRNHTEETLTRNRAVHSEAISDDSDLFGSKEDMSDLLGSRDNISDLPSSRDDISDLPSSRDDMSDLRSSRDDISDLPSSRDDISNCARRKSEVTGGCVNSGVVKKLVFHRSDLQSSTSPMGDPADDSWSMVRQPATDDHTFTALSDSDTHCTFNRRRVSSQDSFGSFLDVSQTPDNTESHGTVLSKHHDQDGGQSEHTHPEELQQTHCVTSSTQKRLTAASHTGTILAEDGAEDQHRSSQHAYHASVGTDKGKQLLLYGPQCPESKSAVVLSCTVYNSSCHSIHGGK